MPATTKLSNVDVGFCTLQFGCCCDGDIVFDEKGGVFSTESAARRRLFSVCFTFDVLSLHVWLLAL